MRLDYSAILSDRTETLCLLPQSSTVSTTQFSFRICTHNKNQFIHHISFFLLSAALPSYPPSPLFPNNRAKSHRNELKIYFFPLNVCCCFWWCHTYNFHDPDSWLYGETWILIVGSGRIIAGQASECIFSGTVKNWDIMISTQYWCL